MAEKKKNKPAVTQKMQTKQKAGFSLASSPRFKTIAAKVEKGELTTAEALDMLIPENLKGEERKKARKKLAQAIGSQNSEAYVTKSRQRINEELRRKGGDYEKKQSRKPGFAKGGMANCGASMKATQKSTNMMYGGMASKKKK